MSDLDLHDLRTAAIRLTLDGQELVQALNTRDHERARRLARTIAERATMFDDVLNEPADPAGLIAP